LDFIKDDILSKLTTNEVLDLLACRHDFGEALRAWHEEWCEDEPPARGNRLKRHSLAAVPRAPISFSRS
jgi:hypothetical protein